MMRSFRLCSCLICLYTLWVALASAQERWLPESLSIDAVHRLAVRYDTFAAVPNDPRGRVVYGTSRGHLHLLEYQGTRYREIWVSPSLVTRVREVQIADLRGDGRYAIIAYNTRGYLYVYDLDNYALVWQSPETQFRSVEALAVAQVDNDPQKELLFLSEGTLYIYDGVHFVEEWRSDVVYQANDVVVGDVDGDNEPEIVLSTGHVLDGFSHVLEWESPLSFGDHLELADIDGDGKLEVIAGTGEATSIWDIDERREKWE